MIKNYFKVAWRNLWKHKLFSFINIFGLALSLSVCMIVIAKIKDDLSYDRFHPQPDRTYRVLSNVTETKGDKKYKLASTPLPLHEVLAGRTDMLESSVRLYPAFNGVSISGNKEMFINGAFTESSFFTVFGFRLSEGDERTALEQPNGIVLTEETAKKFFGSRNAIGQTLSIEKLGVFQVTGILQETSAKSHINFDAYASSKAIAALEKSKQLGQKSDDWSSVRDAYTYVVLKNESVAKSLDQALSDLSAEATRKNKEASLHFSLQSINSITPGSDDIFNDLPKGSVWSEIITEGVVALIILLAACFNYTNLTIARAFTRSKEVGIRKVAGATRRQIIVQYVIEAVMVAFVALAFAYVIFLQLLIFKPFNDEYEHKVIPDTGIDVTLIVSFILFTVFAGLIAGALPAWMLSSFKPARVLKNISIEKLFGSISLKKALIVFQFSLSLIIIIFLSAYYQQFSFLSTANTGFRKENIISIPYAGPTAVFSNALSRISGVENITKVSDNFGRGASGYVEVLADKNKAEKLESEFYFADAATIAVMDLKLIAGNNFPADEEYANEKYILINEKAVNYYGFKSNADAIGKAVWLNDSTSVEVKGVVKDFYYKGAARPIDPMILRSKANSYSYLNVQVNSPDKKKLVADIQKVWAKLNPNIPFSYFWLDEKLDEKKNQTATFSLLGFLAFITISIASLGLLGLVIYTVETRQKEISIRKVLGAGINELLYLLSKGFFKLLLLAGLIAMPLGYMLSFFFLQNFANRVSFGVTSLLLCFIFLLVVGLFTIISNTYRASAANPVKNLRTE